jgi:hypothetical protein
MATIKLTGDDVLVIQLPGLTAIRIDPASRAIAVDGISGLCEGEALSPHWEVLDLRDGAYGDFHRLASADMCADAACAASGQHLGPGRRKERGKR